MITLLITLLITPRVISQASAALEENTGDHPDHPRRSKKLTQSPYPLSPFLKKFGLFEGDQGDQHTQVGAAHVEKAITLWVITRVISLIGGEICDHRAVTEGWEA